MVTLAGVTDTGSTVVWPLTAAEVFRFIVPPMLAHRRTTCRTLAGAGSFGNAVLSDNGVHAGFEDVEDTMSNASR